MLVTGAKVFGVTVRVRGNKSRRFLSAFDYRKLFVNLYKLILKERVSDSCGIYQLNLCNINLEPGPLNSDKLCTKLGNAFDSLNIDICSSWFLPLALAIIGPESVKSNPKCPEMNHSDV